MTENPYAPRSTPSEVVGVLSGTRDDLRGVAQFQKGILVCIAVYLAAIAGQIVFPRELRFILGFAVLLTGLVGAVFVFLLAIKVYGTGLGVLLGILSLVPCVGLIIVLIVNGKATAILRQNGIKVGLLGANGSAV